MNQILTASFNQDIIRFIQSFHNPMLDKFFILLTMSAEEYSIIFVIALIFWCIDKRFGYKLAFAFISSSVFNMGFKDLFKIKRPIGESGIRSLRTETATGYSFPSGHTQGAATLWTSLMLEFKRRWLYITGIAMIFLVALSRVYLGVHRPVDVLVGAILGISLTLLSNLIMDCIDENKNYKLFLIYLIPLILGLLFWKDKTYYELTGVSLGFCLGYIIETKYIKYEARCSLTKQIAKFIIGIGVLLLIRVILKLILGDFLISDLFRYFIIGLWVTVGAPTIFEKFMQRS